MDRFYWLIEGEIAGCSRPGGSNRIAANTTTDQPRTSPSEQLDQDLIWLHSQNIAAVLTLTEAPLEEEVLERHGFEVLHLPVPDMTAPSPEQMQEALDFIDIQRSMGHAVAVHCLMGQGRTGTILAAYLIRRGITAEDAVARLRVICPGAIESTDQQHALQAFAESRSWIL
jgi:atypical dual specificity phosphatase